MYERPTITVWVNATTTAHFWNVTKTVNLTLTTTHEVTATATCVRELNRHPAIEDRLLGEYQVLTDREKLLSEILENASELEKQDQVDGETDPEESRLRKELQDLLDADERNGAGAEIDPELLRRINQLQERFNRPDAKERDETTKSINTAVGRSGSAAPIAKGEVETPSIAPAEAGDERLNEE